jgi:hypothetical protein
MRPHPWLRHASLGLLLLAGACASAPRQAPEARSAELLSSNPPPPGRVCRVVQHPETLPAAELLVDVDALRADVREYMEAEELRSGHVLLSMGYDRFGSNIRRAVIEHSITATAADSIQKLVFTHRRTLEPSEGDWGVRMRIDLDDPPRFDVGRSERCAPRPRDTMLALAMETTMGGSATRYRNGFRESTIWVRLLVNPHGQVTNASVERGIVSGAMLEQRILDHVRSFFFEPALEDGQPASGYVSIPLVVRER